MNVESLAQQLLAFSGRHDGQHDLVVRAGQGHEVYFRFSEDRVDPVHMMTWEARPNAAGSFEAPNQEAGWLTRMDFRRDGDGLVARIVGMPDSIGDARVIAGLASFLLEHAYDLPEQTVVSVAVETA
jgi:hypothetical protein